jgi:DNA polymerase I-like protein with 3'-5' exonuclease and polymerase domains
LNTTTSSNGRLTTDQHAAAAFLASHWPVDNRNNAAGALAGGLLRDGLLTETVEQFIEEVATAAADEEVHKRVERVGPTAEKIKKRAKTTGWPKLAEALGTDGDNVVRRLRIMLGLAIDLAALAAHKALPVNFLESLGLHDLRHGGVGIPYREGGGRVVAVKERTALAAKDGSRWPLLTPLMAYGEDRLEEGAAAGYRTLVEGESDSWTLWYHGFPALGLPGSNTVSRTLTLGHVAGVKRLYVVQEPDGGGAAFVRAVAARLAELRWAGELRVVRLDGHKDPNELHKADPKSFPERFRQALERAEVVPLTPPPAGPGGKRPPRTIAPYRPFPVEALPPPLGDYVRQGADALGCDPAFLALPVLAVVASAIGGTRVIRLKRGWDEPSVVWAAIVGDSGTLKSPAHLKAVSYLFRRQKRLLQEFTQRAAEYQAELTAYQAAKKAFDKGEGPDPGARPEPPVLRRVVCSDTTIEKLAAILEDNPRGTLVARDELAGWFGSFTRYKGKAGGTDLPNWLEMHRAGTVIVDRKTGDRPTLFIPHAAASIAGGIQPGVLARVLTTEFLDAGLAARMLMAMPPRLPKRWSEAEVAEAVEGAYHAVIDRLLDLDFGASDDGDRVPQVLRLSPPARDAWVSFYNDWAREQATAEGELAAAYSKLEAYAARFALIHHVVSRTARGEDDLAPIQRESIEAGVALCRWFAGEARRIYATLSESAQERDTRRLIDFVRARGGRLTAKELQRSNSRKYPTADAATEALEGLVRAGCGCWVDREPDCRGGRPTRDFELHPTTDDTDETSDDDEGAGGDPPAKPPDDTPPAPDDTPHIPEGNGVSSVSSGVGSGSNGAVPVAGVGGGAETSFVGRPEVSSEGLGVVSPSDLGAYRPDEASGWNGRLVRSPAELAPVAQAVEESVRVGVDCETTGLNPRTDRVRLLSLATDRGIYLIDCFAVDPAPLRDVLAERCVVFHNGLFDLQFLRRMGFVPGPVADTFLLSRLLHGTRRPRRFHALGECVARELGRRLDKAEQTSDWSGPLTGKQLGYAALDAAVLLPLFAALDVQVREAGLARVAEIEGRCLPAVAWLADSGVGFDTGAWAALAAEAGSQVDSLARQLDEAAPARPGYLGREGAWAWDSPPQVKEAFALLGHDIERTDDESLARIDHPLAALLREYRSVRKLASTYGPGWAGGAQHGGRIHAGWQQVGADSGRMACRDPNLQNLPRDRRYRRCFLAPEGRVLVKADYSQIELRIAAKVSGDQAMLAAYQTGEDLHTLTAQRVLGVAEVTREQRQLAKAINFGLVYGMGVTGFRAYALAQYGLRLAEVEARRYRDGFFAAYPGLRRWHRSIANPPIDTRTLAGRRRQDVKRYTEKLNTPVQGTGADGLKLALALLWERRAECPGAFPVLVVHDEIVVECDADQAEAVKAWLRQAMVDATAPLIDPVPVEVEAKVGRTWAGD